MKVARKKSSAKSTKADKLDSTLDLEQQIRRRAYDLYEQRGSQAGHETEDWLQAEADLAKRSSTPSAAGAVKTNRKPLATSEKKSKGKQVKNVVIIDAGK